MWTGVAHSVAHPHPTEPPTPATPAKMKPVPDDPQHDMHTDTRNTLFSASRRTGARGTLCGTDAEGDQRGARTPGARHGSGPVALRLGQILTDGLRN